MGGVQSIPFSSIDRYARRYGLEAEKFERFKLMVRAMDAAFLEHVTNQKPGPTIDLQPSEKKVQER